MADRIDVTIQGHDKLSPEMAKARRKTEIEATKLRNNVQSQFRQLGQNILSQVGGPLGIVANQLGGIRHPIGIAIGGITALAGGFLSLSKRAAELNASVSTDSKSLLVGFENLKQRVNDNLNIIGGKGISIFNRFFDLIGVGATKQQILNEEIKRSHELIIATVKSSDEYISKLKEFIVASDRLAETTLTKDYFEAVANGSTRLANSYFRQITNLRILQNRYKNMSEDVKTLADDHKKLNTELEKTNTLALQGAALGALDKSYQDFSARMTEILGKIDAINEAQAESEAIQARQELHDLIMTDNRAKQKDDLQEAVQLQNEMANSMGQAAIQAKNFSNFLQQAALSVVSIAIRATLAGSGLGFLGGLLPFQHGGIVRRPTRALIGEAGPEAVVPLSPGKSAQRDAVMQAAGLTNNNVSLSFNMPNVRSIDQVAIRNELLPAINRQIRRGEKLIASKLR